ncbi:MAG: hypothetical protein CVU89_10215 [Firmicutes bacterium HGW-Firmicutes-14]|nr:MAG: hypothetical protein CVU89_10215 [Firmicutes bacterium HGW-Firmicutes-14]
MGVSYARAGTLYITLATEKEIYFPGEPVRMYLAKTNFSLLPVTLRYPTTQRYDFSITGPGGEIWRWSADRLFNPVIEQVILGPGQHRLYAAEWPQTTHSGERISPGVYRVTGWNTFSGFGLYPAPSVLIRIIS